MGVPYEKMSSNKAQSSPKFIDGSLHVQRQRPVRIRHYFVFSLLSAICLCPATGLIALAYSLKSSAKADVNFHDKARLYSRRSLFWNILSVILAISSLFIVLALFHYFNEMISLYADTQDDMIEHARPQHINIQINKIIQLFPNDK